MSLRRVLRESMWLALTSHVFGALLLVAFAGATATVVSLQATAAADAVAREQIAMANGRDLWIYRRDELGLDSRTCVQLQTWPGVIASGGVGAGEVVGDDRVVPFVGSMPWLLDHALEPGDVLVLGPGVAHPPVAARRALWFGRPDRMADGVRSAEFTNAALIRQPGLGSVQECWVEFEPHDSLATRSAVAAVLAGASGVVEPVQRSRAATRAENLDALTSDHANRAVLPLNAITAAMIVLTLLVRRRELALYRDLGWSANDVLLLATISTWMVVAPATLVGITWAVAVTSGQSAASQLLTGPSAASLVDLLTVSAGAVPVGAAIAVASITALDRR